MGISEQRQTLVPAYPNVYKQIKLTNKMTTHTLYDLINKLQQFRLQRTL